MKDTAHTNQHKRRGVRSLAACAKILGITKTRAHQLELAALRKFRRDDGLRQLAADMGITR